MSIASSLTEKIEERSLDFMTARFWLPLLLFCPLFAASSMAVQELKIGLEEQSRKLHGHSVELNLLLERFNSLEREMQKLSNSSSVDKRIASLERMHKALASDLKSLNKQLSGYNRDLASCQKLLSKLDKKLNHDIATLKESMQSMLALVKGEEESRLYTVKSGDSLGQIALDHRMTTRELKELNQLKNDTIIVGQKLKVKS